MEVEQRLEHGDSDDLNDFFIRAILRSANAPLVIDGLSRKRQFYAYQPDEGQNEVSVGSNSAQLDASTTAVDSNNTAHPSPIDDLGQPVQDQAEVAQQVAIEMTSSETELPLDRATSPAPLDETATQGTPVAQSPQGGKPRRGKAAPQPAPASSLGANDDDIDIPNFIAEVQRKAKQ